MEDAIGAAQSRRCLLTAETLHHGPRRARLLGITFEQVQAASVWLMMVSSFFVSIEPAPCDLLFMATFCLFAMSGLRISMMVVPMILYLLLYNLGALISYMAVPPDDKAAMFVITSAYMAVSAIFFSFYVVPDPLRRMAVFTNGYLVGAVIAAIIALAGYFDVASLGAVLAPLSRAQGTFKDPNVLSTYLIFPGLLLTQGFMLGKTGHRLLRTAALLTILAALFLAFSRGAWISFSLSAVLMALLTFVLTPSAALRSRIVILSIVGVTIIAILIAYLLSVESVRTLFYDRLTLAKNYDVGEHGRFGIQANSIQYLLQHPFGLGPAQFGRLFGQAPHNVFLNAFAAYSWLGGISYLILIFSTLIVGFKAVLARTPWQNCAIVVFCPLLASVLQGIQIDTDHWRHFYWMLGLMWGLFAASAAHFAKPSQPALRKSLA
jgi:hypothetical protein